MEVFSSDTANDGVLLVSYWSKIDCTFWFGYRVECTSHYKWTRKYYNDCIQKIPTRDNDGRDRLALNESFCWNKNDWYRFDGTSWNSIWNSMPVEKWEEWTKRWMCHGSQIIRQEGLKIGIDGLCVVTMWTKRMNDRAAPQSTKNCGVCPIPTEIFLRETRGIGTALGYWDQDCGCILPKKKDLFSSLFWYSCTMGMNKEQNSWQT